MASGSLGAEEAREKPRWNENSKVYTRKIKSKTTQNFQNALQPANIQTSNGNSATAATVTTALDDGKAVTTTAFDDGKPGTMVAATKRATDDETLAVPSATAKDTDEERPATPVATTKDTYEEKIASPVTTSKKTDEERPAIPVATTEDTDEGATAATHVAISKDNDDERTAIVTTENTHEEQSAADTNDERAATTMDANDEIAATTTAADNENATNMSTCLTVPDDNGNCDTSMPDVVNGVLSLEDCTNNGDSVPALELNSNAPALTLPGASSSPQPAEDVNHPHHQNNLLRTEAVVSEDSSTLNQQITTIPNGGNPRNVEANGLIYVKPAITRIDGKVSICLSALNTKKEAKDLKRKLVSELQMVRNVCRKLEEKEGQISVAGNILDPVTVGHGLGIGGGRTLFPANGGTGVVGNAFRANTQARSSGFNESRPFRSLSVSVVNNNLGPGEIVEKEKRTPKANQFYRSADFIYGKDKLPPAESNKKHKSSSKKHGGGGGVGFAMDKQLFKKCSSLLQRLMKHKHGWVFNTPVDVRGLGLHDYYEIIKHPMDLGTVKNKLNSNWYKSPFEFAEDVRLTFRNAKTYNPEGQDVHVMAVELSNIFEEKWEEIEADYSQKMRYEMSYNVGLPTPRTRVPSYVAPPMPYIPAPSLSAPYNTQDLRRLDRSESLNLPVDSRPKTMVYRTSATRTPALKKPKAKDPNKRDMTFEEKQRLSTHLQGLPPEKLETIVQIIKKRNLDLRQEDDEIEVDIDSVDAETLWELDRFVTNYKKGLSKRRRRAEQAQAKAADQQAVAAQQTIPAPPSVEVPREMITDETNVAASSPVQEDNQTNNASGSSSSSSSSSGSGSSSSDSDSDSSSGSG